MLRLSKIDLLVPLTQVDAVEGLGRLLVSLLLLGRQTGKGSMVVVVGLRSFG